MDKVRVHTNNPIKKWLWNSNFIYYYWFRRSDRRIFSKIIEEDRGQIVEKLLSGIGGVGNIRDVKPKKNSIIIHFASRYLIKKEDLNSCKGIGVQIFPNSVSIVFFYPEVKGIVKSLREAVDEFKSKHVSLDIDPD